MKTIFFPRYQRRFLRMGDVGSHPQFRHLDCPPNGFRFESKNLGWMEWFAALPGAGAAAFRGWRDLFSEGSARALSWIGVIRFLYSRGLNLVPAPPGFHATFLPTFPFTHQNENWFLEIEDVTTLFRPYVLNGQTKDVKLRDLPQFPIVKGLLESKNCLGILTHVSSTQSSIQKLFDSSAIDGKTEFLATPYLPPVEIDEMDLNSLRSSEETQFFFNNSWHQDPTNFYLRGGISILEAFDRAFQEGLPVRLILRSKLPKDLVRRFSRVLTNSKVEVIDRFLPTAEYLRILRSSHYFLLPSARLHVVSLLESMYYGAVPIVSDGWGIDDYIEPDIDALIVAGARGHVSWVDQVSGELREDYLPMYKRPGIFTDELFAVIKRVVNSGCHRDLSVHGHRRICGRHSVEKFNLGFSRFLDNGLRRI